MWKNRLGYILTAGAMFLLVFFFGEPFLLYAGTALILIALVVGIGMHQECRDLEVRLKVGKGVRGGEELPLEITVRTQKSPWFLRCIQMDLTIQNEMFQTTEQTRLILPLAGRANCFAMKETIPVCGEIEVTCSQIRAYDFLRLFCTEIDTLELASTVVYPKRRRLQVQLSRTAAGIPKYTGMVQNRKGSDPSEMFDIRDYTPGDDIRSIHWKLSSKTDNLILRQASDPAHYNTVLLPDFGRNQLEQEHAAEQINATIGYAVALGEELLRQNAAFGFAFPTPQGLKIEEVRNRSAFQQLIALWLSVPVQEMSGTGLRYFEMNHMEERFTKLILFAAGDDMPNPGALNGKIDVTVLAATETEHIKTSTAGTCERLELSSRWEAGKCERIIC